ncbi:hypothetical protein [Arsenicibacter rosenii]|uniref:Chromosome condensation regulator RCC1 n=1 Tax=Arsenicibacter rosenii TaxID=1750698 RepID=A0A1S2VLS1_9BACT|nr:hypothetical protein [Arsenicibacter rosenii]OIN58748.1 hypothetical protein BLX24_14435 [Arsenicibacter rosenii]
MKLFIGYILLALLLLGVGEAIAQTTVTLPSVCANCPTTPSNPQAERTPCNGLLNAKDFSGFTARTPVAIGQFISGFISGEGTVYVGWFNNYAISSVPETCMTGFDRPASGTALHSSPFETMYTALPAQNVLMGAPGQTFKAIQRALGYFFVLSDQGKIYNWGSRNASQQLGLSGPAGTTLTASDGCDKYQQLREIPHPGGKKWVSMQISHHIGYAADEDGQWWCWGSGNSGNAVPKALMPSKSIPLPGTGANYATSYAPITFTPIKMDRLRVQPLVAQTDDQQTLVTAASYTTEGVDFLSYIGSDSLVYAYVHNYDSQNGFQSDTTITIPLPAGVKAKKIQRGYLPPYTIGSTNYSPGCVDYVLGTDGNIYKFVDNKPTVAKVSLGTYTFRDFIVRDPWEQITGNADRNGKMLFALDLVPVSGPPLVSVSQHSDPVSTVGESYYDSYAWTDLPFTVSKLWASASASTGFTILKSAANNHSYALNTRLNIASGLPYHSIETSYSLAVALGMFGILTAAKTPCGGLSSLSIARTSNL